VRWKQLAPYCLRVPTACHFRSVPKPLVNHSVWFTLSPHLALLSSITRTSLQFRH